MTIVSLRDIETRLAELAARVQAGEILTVMCDGKPLFDVVPHQSRDALRSNAIAAEKRRLGVENLVEFIADDFDAPMDESDHPLATSAI
ncbi:MAG: prevent-host-death protein [Hyphomicrobiaceae bacterium]|nr:prevent-host-death protein [Hyphomicrobiaceae bacterium]